MPFILENFLPYSYLVAQESCLHPTCSILSPRWLQRISRYTNPRNKPVPFCCIGGSRKNGPRWYTNGCASRTKFWSPLADLSLSLGRFTQATSTGQLNTIMTFYEIVEPPIPSELSSLPIPLLKKAIAILMKTSRAQIIAVADGEGVRFLPGTSGK